MPENASPAATLKDLFWKHKASRVRVSPCNSLRASSIGVECDAFLFLEQTAWEKRVPPTPEMQCIFDLGNEMEMVTFRELEAMGVQVLQRGKDYVDRRYNITGHIDGKLRIDGFPKPIPAEIKGLNPYTAGSIETIDHIRHHPQAWVRKYYAQLQIYLLLDESELGVFVLKNKSTGQVVFVDCPLDYAYAESLLAKAERVGAAVKSGTFPARNVSDDCMGCAFVHVCQPDIEFTKGVEFFENTEIAEMLRRREELAASAKEFDAVDKAIKAALPKKGQLIVGDYALTGKEVERSAYAVSAGSYWKWNIKRLLPGVK